VPAHAQWEDEPKAKSAAQGMNAGETRPDQERME
jgi:hypothetical protein